MMSNNKSLESGSLLAVLRRASHDELSAIFEAIDQAVDIRPKRSAVYKIYREGLTRIPEMVEYWLCSCGGHAIKNFFRDGGPPYREVVYDVCRKVGVQGLNTCSDVLGMEGELLRCLVAKALARMTPEQKQKFMQNLNANLAQPINFAQLVGQGAAGFGVIGPLLFSLLSKEFVKRGIAVVAAEVAGVALGGVLTGVGALASVVWLGYDIGGPSYRGTVPAVVQVALLRQHMMWSGRE